MEQHLKKCKRDLSLPESLRVASAAGLAKLEKYYSAARANHHNIIATSEFIQLHFVDGILTPLCSLSSGPSATVVQEAW